MRTVLPAKERGVSCAPARMVVAVKAKAANTIHRTARTPDTAPQPTFPRLREGIGSGWLRARGPEVIFAVLLRQGANALRRRPSGFALSFTDVGDGTVTTSI